VTASDRMSEPGPGGRDGATAAPSDDDVGIGWLRALLSGVVVLIVGFGGAVVGSNAILTKSLALTRTAREWLATALFFAVVVVLAWALRRLQARKVI
jgi:hypothetical protein